MKSIKGYLLNIGIFLILFIEFGCSQSKNNIQAVNISYDIRERRGSVIIAENDSMINHIMLEDSFYIYNHDYLNTFNRFTASNAAIEYLSEYISKNCNKVDEDSMGGLAIFTINSYSDKHHLRKPSQCYVYLQSAAINYFTGMIEWIEKSPYKGELKEFVTVLQSYRKRS